MGAIVFQPDERNIYPLLKARNKSYFIIGNGLILAGDSFFFQKQHTHTLSSFLPPSRTHRERERERERMYPTNNNQSSGKSDNNNNNNNESDSSSGTNDKNNDHHHQRMRRTSSRKKLKILGKSNQPSPPILSHHIPTIIIINHSPKYLSRAPMDRNIYLVVVLFVLFLLLFLLKGISLRSAKILALFLLVPLVLVLLWFR